MPISKCQTPSGACAMERLSPTYGQVRVVPVTVVARDDDERSTSGANDYQGNVVKYGECQALRAFGIFYGHVEIVV